jgi:chemotaxis protein CheY-P-specific phosphatase CheC
MKNVIFYVSIAVIALLSIIGILYIISSNKEHVQRNLVVSQQKVCEANFDKMHKTIAQIAEVADAKMEQSKEAFKEIYPELISGRYDSDNGMLMKWIQESNPQFDLVSAGSIYDKLAVAIEANREEYFNEQEKLISYRNEHNNILTTFPGSVFFPNREKIEIVIITSEYTENTYKSGKEDDISIY